MDRPFDAVGARHDRLQRCGIFSAEIEDLANLDAPRAQPLLRRDITLETHCIVHVLGRGIEAGPRPNVRHQVRIIIDAFVRGGQIDHVAVAENARLAGFCQNDELVREVAADGPRFGRHRNSFEPHARKRAKVSNEHLVVRNSGGSFVDIEGIGVLHQKLATAHHAEAGALLVAEFPLDVIQDLRQLAIGTNVGAENLGDHLLVSGAVKHVPLVPILDAQHFRAIGVVAPALAPKIGKLQGGHQQLDRARTVLLLANDLLDFFEHPKTERQPSVNAGGLLANEACAQHEAVGDHLRLLGRLTQDRQEVMRQAHEDSRIDWLRRSETGTQAKRQGLSKLSSQLERLPDGPPAAQTVRQLTGPANAF